MKQLLNVVLCVIKKVLNLIWCPLQKPWTVMIKLSVEMNIILNLSTLQLIMCWCFAVQRSAFPPEAALLLKIFHSLYLHVFNSTFNIVLMLYLKNSTLNNHNNIRTLHIYTITVSVLYWSLCCLGKYFYFENLKNRYFMLTNILPFPVSPAGYFEFNLCAITLENCFTPPC